MLANRPSLIVRRISVSSRSVVGNSALLETFNQIVGGSSKESLQMKPIESTAAFPKTFTSFIEPAQEYNIQRHFNCPSLSDFHRFKVGELYSPSDLISEKDEIKSGAAVLGIEERRFVDIFRRSKVFASQCYKNTVVLTSLLSQTGRILPRKTTGYSAKTQRQLSKAIRRARQMGIIPYMQKPE